MPVPADPPEHAARFRQVVSITLAGAIALAVHGLLWKGSYGFFSGHMDFNRGALEDFLGVYLPAAEQMAGGGGGVQGFIYGPVFAWALQPFVALGPSTASSLWLGLQFAAALGLIVLGWRVVSASAPGLAPRWLAPAYVLAAGLSFPLAHNLHWGQVSTLIVLAIVHAAGTRRENLAGVVIGCTAAVKFYPGVFLVLFLFGGQRKAFACGMVTVALVSLLPVLQLGWAGAMEDYVGVLRQLSQHSGAAGSWIQADNNQSLAAVLGRLPNTSLMAVWCYAGVGVLVACWLGSLSVRWMNAGTPQARVLSMALALLTLPLVLSPSWPHYFAGLPFIQCFLARWAGRDSWAWVSIGLSVALSTCPFFRWVGDPELYGRYGFLLASNLVLIPALLRVGGQVTSPAR